MTLSQEAHSKYKNVSTAGIGAGGPLSKAATGPEPCSRYAGDISLYQTISSVRGVHLILLLTP
jgi:hypothetical protein